MAPGPTPSDVIRQRLIYTYHLFKPIRARFNGASIERGGFEREGVAPVYKRKLKSEPSESTHYIVESSFSEPQLKAVHETLVALRSAITGKTSGNPLTTLIVNHYLSPTAPYFGMAMLKATEQLLAEFVASYPEHAAVLDAVFRVAGADGFRDLVQIYGIRLVEAVLSSAEIHALPLMAFVDVHDTYRKNSSGELADAKYEVWCPGQSLAQAYFDQCVTAARQLVDEHRVTFAPPARDELRAFPFEISSHFRVFLQQSIEPILTAYRIT